MSFGFGFGFPKNYVAATLAPFTPAALFTGSTNGVWYDPSDLTTLYQDAAGTMPVTAVEQPVGLMLDKHFSEALNPIVSKYAVNSGTAGLKFTTPDSTVNSITGSIDIRWFGQLSNVTGSHYIASKWVSGGSLSYLFSVGSGLLSFSKSLTGTGQVNANATATLTTAGVAANTDVWLRVTHNTTSGDTNFYTSTNGTTWSQIGSTVTIATGAIFDSTAYVEITTAAGGNATSSIPRTYRAQIYNGIDGVLAVDFCPPYGWASGTWVSAKTGETWTVGAGGSVTSLTTTGNHAFQSNSANRPTLSARYNLLTKTEQFGDAYWSKAPATATVPVTNATSPIGTSTACKFAEGTTTAFHSVSFTAAASPATSVSTKYKFSVYVKPAGRTWIALELNNPNVTGYTTYFNLSGSGSIGQNPGANTDTSIVEFPVGSGWYLCSISKTTLSNQTQIQPSILPKLADGGGAYTGDGTSGIYIWGADLRVANDALNQPAYQRVNTNTDYDTVGFKPYLQFAGGPPSVNASMQTNPINFTNTAQMFVCAGVRKLSDAQLAVVAELSAAWYNNSGSFILFNGYNLGSGPYWTYASQGTVLPTNAISPNTYASPVTNVLSGISSISTDTLKLRANGVEIANSTGDQGTGNFDNYPLYIGARAGTSLFFNGRLYQMVIAGKQATDTEILQTEDFMELKTFNKDMSWVYDGMLTDAAGNPITDTAGNQIYTSVIYQ